MPRQPIQHPGHAVVGGLVVVVIIFMVAVLSSAPVLATTPEPVGTEAAPPATTVEAPAPRDVPITGTVATTTVPVEAGEEVPGDVDEPIGSSTVSDGGRTRTGAAPSVRTSDIPLGSILLAVLVLVSVGAAAVVVARRTAREPTATRDASLPPDGGDTGRAAPLDLGARAPSADVETLEFLVELGEALLDAGDAVGHVEATIVGVAQVNGIRGLGLLVLPSSLVLSLHDGDSVVTEVSTSASAPLRLDQIDDVFRLVDDVERAQIGATEGLRALDRIRTRPPASSAPLLVTAYVVSTIGLAMLLRGSWVEVTIAAVLGVVIGGLRLATASQQAAYQVFWPLISAAAVSASVFATARVFTDLAVFPALIAPLVSFLPGGLLTIGVLELATGQIVSGASRVAAGTVKLVLLAIGIVAGAQLVGVPGGDIRAGGSGTLSSLVPWVGVGLFGVGIAQFNGARKQSFAWILVALYVAYAGQVVGGLFFGSALSAFFGAVVMTPVALFASRQRFGPTPLVTFLPGFWLLVPGALGLDGVTRIVGQGVAGSTGASVTTVTSMVGVSLGVLLGLILAGADPARPWSDSRRRRRA